MCYFLFEHFVYCFKAEVLSYNVLFREMLNKCIMFSNSKTIV